MKPFNLERALAGDKVVHIDGKEIKEFHLFNTDLAEKDKRLCYVREGSNIVYCCTADGREVNLIPTGKCILFMAAKIQFNWFVRSNKVNTQGASGIPGYWQSNVLVGEEGRKYLVDHYAHRLGHELTLHSQEIEE